MHYTIWDSVVVIGGSGDEYWRKPLEAMRREATAIKNGNDWFGAGENYSLQRRASSGSSSRRAASAMIAEIPFDLARWVARCFKPTLLTGDTFPEHNRFDVGTPQHLVE